MKKILVPTDFSPNSKAGMRFAIQLCTQHKYELTFFHSYYTTKPTSLSDAAFTSFKEAEIKKIQTKLNQFVNRVYKNLGVEPGQINCVVKGSILTDSNIREYASKNKFSYICIGTRGAGKLKKMFGTNTSQLINHSPVPVIAIPEHYKAHKIKSVLYASDLTNLESELKLVIDFAKPIKSKVELLHFNSPIETAMDSKTIKTAVKKLSNYDVTLHFENANPLHTLISNIEFAVEKSKPSVLIMFTQQNRTFFQKLFLSSKSSDYSFNAKVPLLVFNKS